MSSLYEVFAQLPDPRSTLGRRRPLSAIRSQAALALLDVIEVEGSLVTGDAMFCQRDLSR